MIREVAITDGPMHARRATRADVARRARVAPSTVSIVLNGRAEQVQLAPSTVQRVQRAAADLNYVPSAAGRALKRQRSRLLGLLLAPVPPRAAMPIFQDLVIAAIERARQDGYLVLPIPEASIEQGAGLVDPFAVITDVDVAGVICQVTDHNTVIGERLARAGIPVVWLAPFAPPVWPAGHGRVYIDVSVGSTELAAHLHERGHRRVAFVGPAGVDLRFEPFIRRFGEGCTYVPTSYWLEADGRTAFNELGRQGRLPTAIVCANDLLAVGVIQAAHQAGLRVPEDVAVGGFGDFDISKDLSPTLTTATWPLRRLTHTAVEILLHAIDTPSVDLEPSPIRLPTTAMLRDSTGIAAGPRSRPRGRDLRPAGR